MADVILPPLPVEFQDPWYADREAFDTAVKTQLEGPLSASGLSESLREIAAVVNLRSYGADPDGVVPAEEAWAAMIADVPSGTEVIVDGNFLFNDILSNGGKEIHVNAYGSTVTRGNVAGTAESQLAFFTGSYGTVNMVSSIAVSPADGGTPGTTTLTLTASATDLAEGDMVRVICDNYVPASRDNASRAAFSGVVASVSGTTVVVFGVPYSGDPFTTNVRVARVNPITSSWRGGTMKRTPEFVTPAVGGSLVYFADLVGAQISDVFVPLSSGAGFQIVGCYGTDLSNLNINLLRDSWTDTGTSGPVFAYHVLDTNSFGTHLRDSRMMGGRHGFSTAQASPGSGGGITSNMRSYGITEHALIEGVHVEGSYVAGFDTHESARGVVFDNIVAVGTGFAGVGLRGRDHKVSNFEIVDCNSGFYIFDGGLGGESYGHQISDGIIDNPRSNAIVADQHRTNALLPNYGLRQGPTEISFTANNVEVRNAKASAVLAINARVGQVNMDVRWAVTPTATQAVLELVNSEIRGGTIHSDNRLVTSNAPSGALVTAAADTSVVDIETLRVQGTTAQLDRIARSSSSAATFIMPDVLLDDEPTSTATGSTFSASSVLDYRTITGGDSGRIGISGASTDLSLLGRSMHPVLTVQATITAVKTLPNLPAGKMQGQVLNILNRPATGATGQSTANLTVNHGGTIGAPNGANTWLTGAANKVLTPGQSCRLQWDATINRWCEI